MSAPPTLPVAVAASGISGTVSAAHGGTGTTTNTPHGVLIGAGASAITATAVGATGKVLTGVTGADPTWQDPGAVTLAGDVTGPSGSNAVAKIGGIPVSVLGQSDGTVLGFFSNALAPVNVVSSITGTLPVSASASTGPVTLSLAAGSYAQFTQFTGAAITAIVGGLTGYLVSPGISAAATSDVALIAVTANQTCVVRELVIRADTAPGIGQSITVTLRKRGIGGAWADTAAVVVLSGNATFNNATVAISLTGGGDLLGFKAVQSAASAAAGITVTGLITAT